MWVYYFDSMSTRIREFRTIKGAEFYIGSNIILNPSNMQRLPKMLHLFQNEFKINGEADSASEN